MRTVTVVSSVKNPREVGERQTWTITLECGHVHVRGRLGQKFLWCGLCKPGPPAPDHCKAIDKTDSRHRRTRIVRRSEIQTGFELHEERRSAARVFFDTKPAFLPPSPRLAYEEDD